MAHIPQGARADPKPWAIDAVRHRRTARVSLDADPGPAETRDPQVAAKRKAAEVEENARRRVLRNFATEELNGPAKSDESTSLSEGWK